MTLPCKTSPKAECVLSALKGIACQDGSDTIQAWLDAGGSLPCGSRAAYWRHSVGLGISVQAIPN
jgi:hypothetical protein